MAWLIPGVSVHEGGGRLPLGCSSLQDLIHLVLVVHRDLLEAFDDHTPLNIHTVLY